MENTLLMSLASCDGRYDRSSSCAKAQMMKNQGIEPSSRPRYDDVVVRACKAWAPLPKPLHTSGLRPRLHPLSARHVHDRYSRCGKSLMSSVFARMG